MSKKNVPSLVVFDLDMTLWNPEMYILRGEPNQPVREDGLDYVVGASNGTQTVKIFPGARLALNELKSKPEFKNVKIAAASSTEEPDFAFAALSTIELKPGLPLRDVFDYVQIGRHGKLSSDKRTHFALLKSESGFEYSQMLFFDDCNWEDHVALLDKQIGLCGYRCPRGLTEKEWRAGLRAFSDRQTIK
eukprot:g2155.t1